MNCEWRRLLLKLGAASAAIYVVVQLVQRGILIRMPAAASAVERLQQRVDALNVLRLWLVFLSFFLLPIFVGAVVANVREERRPLAAVGGVFFLVFIVVELLYRSVELIAVVGNWVPNLLSETDAVRRLVLETHIAAFDQWVHAWYYVLLGSQLVGSLVFATAVYEPQRWNRLAAAAFGVNAVRLMLRMLESYAGIVTLQRVNAVIYTPAVTLIFLTVAVWLWRSSAPARVRP